MWPTLTHVQIRARDLSEVLLSAGSESLHEPDTRDPDILTRLHNVWTNNNIDPNKDYYTPECCLLKESHGFLESPLDDRYFTERCRQPVELLVDRLDLGAKLINLRHKRSSPRNIAFALTVLAAGDFVCFLGSSFLGHN